MIDVTVKSPEDGVVEFYGLVGRWPAGELRESAVDSDGLTPEASSAPPSEWATSEGDLALARLVWPKLSPRAVAFFSAPMVEPGRRGDWAHPVGAGAGGGPGVRGCRCSPSR